MTPTELNFHHLMYFWVVAREGGLVAAARKLNLSHPTISGQLRQLEAALGTELFDRSRRRLELTEAGNLVLRYADEIFSLGNELQKVVRGEGTNRRPVLNVGVVDVLPKLVAKRLIEPALSSAHPMLLRCFEDEHERLLARLATHELDVVLADAPVPAGSSIRAYNHVLGECGVTFFATADEARRHRRGFPGSLHELPFLMPAAGTSLRRSLETWLRSRDIEPDVVAEFDDSALLKVFASEGLGAFCAPSVVERSICSQHGVQVIGRTNEVRERFYAISGERRVRHPLVAAICEAARADLFEPGDDVDARPSPRSRRRTRGPSPARG